jgi:DNA polymerase-1
VLLLVDGNNLFMRAWHATRHEAMTAGDESTASLVVFTNTLLRHIREEKPDRVAVCWDGGKSAYRSRLLPSYKANRTAGTSERAKHERGLIKQFLSLAGVFHVERPGVEADDLIAKYWHDAEEDVVLVSEDKDFLQLVGYNPRVYPCSVLRSTGERWGAEEVAKTMGVTPQCLPHVMALTGDDSDNVPGVPGIGPKKAVQLLSEAGWALESIEHPDVRQMAPQVKLNYVLVNLRLPLPGLELPEPPRFRPTTRDSALYDGLLSFLEQYQLKGLIARTLSGTLWVDGSTDN